MQDSLANVVRTIRLGESRLKELFDSLDNAASPEIPDSREHKRFIYRQKIILMQIVQPGAGDATNFVCPTRNVSRGGLACLHGGYLHVGSRCVAHLRTVRGSFEPVLGTVVRCRHVQGTIHDVGIKFDFWIDPSLFCHEAVRYQALVADLDKPSAAAVREALGALSCTVTVAENASQLDDLAMGRLFDFTLVDVDLPNGAAFATMKSLREKGYTGPVFAASAKNSDDEKKQCLDVGFNDYLPKPYDAKALAELAKSHFAAPIHSKLEAKKETEALFAGFFRALPAKVRAIEQAAAAKDEQLSKLVQSFRDLNRSLGFDAVVQSSETLLNSLSSTPEVNLLQKQVAELIGVCRRLRP